ncbi:MAG: glutamine amidotransferase [Phycisphaerales bacterium]
MTLGPLRFEHPGWLLLLLLIPLAWWIARAGRGSLSRGRRTTSLVVRALVILALTAALAEPSVVHRSDDLAVIVVADASRSVPRDRLEEAERFVVAAAEARERPEDRLAVVTVAQAAEVAALPEAGTEPGFGGHAGADAGTNLAEGLRLALAIVPQDAAARILLVSDGNETDDRVLEAADLARANRVPVDVLPIRYRRDGEIVLEELRAPTRARVGQTVELRVSLRSGAAASGRLVLRHDDRLVDLDPSGPGTGLPLMLEPGVNTFLVPVSLDRSGAHRFEAVFEPDEGAPDVVAENNRGAAATFISGEGRVLILDVADDGAALEEVLRTAGIEVERRSPEVLGGRAATTIAGFDAVVLANVPRWAIDPATDRLLRGYVHDLGGGLMMMGGDRSFGAGGWIDSETAEAIPVEMDPPQERQLVRGVLGLIMHSCEMAEGNYWSEQVAISAIEALTAEDYAGIITFEWGASNETSWAHPLQPVGDKSRAVAAARRMTVGDMPDFGPSIDLLVRGISDLEAEGGVRFGQRHAIIISDGDAMPPSEALVERAIDLGLTITTVMVAGHGSAIDRLNMERLAQFTGGTFYEVDDPNALPEIFIKEAVVVSRSLIVDDAPFVPTSTPDPGGPLSSTSGVPPLLGYVLTVPREGLARVVLERRTNESDDPIYAWWNHGTGRAIAFTSDFSGRWGREWLGWAGASAFWEESMRWLMRSAAPRDLVLRTRIDGKEAVVEVESMAEDGGPRGFLAAEGRLVRPDGSVEVLPLRQTGPGRAAGRFSIDSFGSHLVSVAVPGEDGTRGTIQGAVTVPYAREFLATRDDSALLRAVAERTGGRVIDMGDPRLADLFLHEAVAVPLAPRRFWDILILVALGLFLIDVAVRRLSLFGDGGGVLSRLAGRRSSGGDGRSVAAWQRARARAGGESEFDSATDAPDTARGAVAPRPTAKDPAARPAETPATPNAGDSSSASGSDSGPDSNSQEPSSESVSHTSRLLLAKRKARGEAGEGGGHGA